MVTFVIVLSCLLVPASATSASMGIYKPVSSTGIKGVDYYSDHYDTDIDSDYNYYNITPPVASYYITEIERNEYRIKNYGEEPVVTGNPGIALYDRPLIGPYKLSEYGDQVIYQYAFDFSFFENGYFLDLTKIEDGFVIDLELDVDIKGLTGSGYRTPSFTKIEISYYDSVGNYISTASNTDISQDKTYLTFWGRIEVDKPSGAKYASISAHLDRFGTLREQAEHYQFLIEDVKVRVGSPRKDIVTQNYRDLYEDVTSDEKYTYFFINVNQEIGTTKLTSGDANYSLVYGDRYDEISFLSNPEVSDYRFFFRVFQPRRYLELDNIPNGTGIGISCNFNIDADVSWFFPYVRHSITYYDSNFNVVSQDKVSLGRDYDFVSDTQGETFSTFVIEKPSNAKYLTVSVLLQNWHTLDTFSRVPVTVSLDEFQLVLAISTIELEKEYENTILDQNDTLIDQNNSLINGTPQQNEQMNSAVGEMESAGDKLGSLNEQMQVEKPDIDSFDVSIDTLVPYDTLLAYTSPFTSLWESNTLLGMLMIVLTLVLVSWVMFGKKG